MRIKIMVATALALAAIGLKALDSGKNTRAHILPAMIGTQNDAPWPPGKIEPHFP